MQKGTGGVMGEHEIFKTTIMGGFDKEDVLEQVQRMKDEAAAEQLRLKKLISEKDAKIAELMKRIELKDAHQERLEMEIHEKYQKYIDNYESIGKLVFDAQLKSDAMIKDAEEKCNTMISEAEAEAKQRVEAVPVSYTHLDVYKRHEYGHDNYYSGEYMVRHRVSYDCQLRC